MTVRTGRRAAKQPAEVRRETLLDAAIRVFARTAYRSAGTAEIAREAGVAEPTIYRHFDSKRDLYLAALERCGAIIREEFARIDAATPLAHEALAAMGGWYNEAMETDPAYLRLRQRALAETDDPDVQRWVRACYEEILAIFAHVLQRGQEQGTISRAIDPMAGAWLFLAIGHTMDLSRLIGLGEELGEDGRHGMTAVFKRALMTLPE
ncbi:MAG: TetR/AcrR family transcriptional regulator [Dehalococcoidia bacterium]